MLPPRFEIVLRQAATPWLDTKPGISPSSSKWFSNSHMIVFNDLCRRKPDGVFLELGTWTGMGSTQFVLSKYPKMSMICVDTWEGSEEHHRKAEYKKIVVQLWDHFCANHWNNRNRIYPFKTTTVEGMQRVASLGIVPDFIYIDAAHDQESVYTDIRTAITLFPKSVILGDDYVPKGSGHLGVRLAVEQAVAEKLFSTSEFKRVQRVWWLTRNLK